MFLKYLFIKKIDFVKPKKSESWTFSKKKIIIKRKYKSNLMNKGQWRQIFNIFLYQKWKTMKKKYYKKKKKCIQWNVTILKYLWKLKNLTYLRVQVKIRTHFRKISKNEWDFVYSLSFFWMYLYNQNTLTRMHMQKNGILSYYLSSLNIIVIN